MNRFTDIHHHLTYGVDDGPSAWEGTERMLLAACKNGIGKIIATPHVSPGRREFDLPDYLSKVKQMNAYCAQKGLPLSIYSGAEIFYTEATLRFLDAGRIPTLAGTRYVLPEFKPDVTFDWIYAAARTLMNEGYYPVLAHIERYDCLVRHVERVYELRDFPNLRLQINCSTVIKPHGFFFVKKFCERLFHEQMIDYVATDSHNTHARAVNMREAYRVLRERYGLRYAAQLTGLNQDEILNLSVQ